MERRVKSPHLSKEDCDLLAMALPRYIEELENETDGLASRAGEDTYGVILCRETVERAKRILLRCKEFANQKD